jgi:hypothetical protein
MLVCVFAFLSYKQESDAFVMVAVAAVGVALVGYLLVASGLQFTSEGDAQSAAEACYAHCQDVTNQHIQNAKLVYYLAEDGYKLVVDTAGDLWDAVKTWVDDNYDAGDQGPSETNITSDVDIDWIVDGNYQGYLKFCGCTYTDIVYVNEANDEYHTCKIIVPVSGL